MRRYIRIKRQDRDYFNRRIRAWRAKNPHYEQRRTKRDPRTAEDYRISKRKWREIPGNIEKERAYAREYYRKNRDRLNEYRRKRRRQRKESQNGQR
jgi:hypothetical protein